MRFPGFVGPSYQTVSKDIECMRTLNLYAEMDETGVGKDGTVISLVGTPGLALLSSIGSGPIRGTHRAKDGSFYVVSGSSVYLVTSTFTSTLLGTISSSTGQVSMADNGLSLFLVENGNGWISTLGSTTITQTTDANWQPASYVCLIDGYFVFVKKNSYQYFVSQLLSTTINPLGFASMETPGSLVGILSDHRNLWLFGDSTIEAWSNAQLTPGSPFQIIPGATMEVGCVAGGTIQQVMNTFMWLGSDKNGGAIVYIANGYLPQRVSTHAVEFAIQNYGSLKDSTAYAYEENGHHFYVLNCAGADTTWVYDLTTQLWHERNFTNAGVFQRHLADNHTYIFGKHVVGDYKSGNLYQLSSSVYSDNGSPITRQRISPHLSAESKRVFYHKFSLDMQTGVGLDGLGQGTQPQAMLKYSDDGGYNYSNEIWTTIGKIGQTKARCEWHRLGSSRDRVFNLTITDPVRVVILGADLDFTVGTN